MSYNATSWVNGSTSVNASNMNKIETGISNNADAIDALNTVSSESVSVTILDRSGTIIFRKFGRVCVCRINCTVGSGSSTTGANEINATAPSGFRPQEVTNVPCAGLRSNVITGNWAFRINADGSMYYFTDYSSNAVEMHGVMTYITSS